MAQKCKVARVPSYWFGWYPKRRPLEFYVRVYLECRRLKVRKSNKPKVMSIMHQLDNCDRYVTSTTYSEFATSLDYQKARTDYQPEGDPYEIIVAVRQMD